MSSDRLTTAAYWDAGYVSATGDAPLVTGDFRRHPDLQVARAIRALGLDGRRVLEIGAGNSALLTHLARGASGAAAFTGLDYTPTGCRLLAERARREGVSISVVQQDLFTPDSSLAGSFDLVYSIGVVEHFADLASVLRAMKRYLSRDGMMFTLIPNMRGLPGALVRRYNRQVFEMHTPHDLASFRAGHQAAGMEVLSASFLCSTNFGVLSSCFQSPADRGFTTYKWLSRLSKALWLIESRVGDLPALPALAPYLVAVSRAARTD